MTRTADPAASGGSARTRLAEALTVATGPQLYGRTVFLLGLAWSIALQLPGMPGESGHVVARMGLAVLAHLLMFAAMRVGREVGRIGRARPVPWAVVTVVAAGAIRGAVLQALFIVSGLSVPGLYPFRIVNGAIAIGVAVLVASYAVGILSAERTALRRLRAEELRLRRALSASSTDVAEWHRSTARAIHATLLGAIDEARERGLDASIPELKALVGDVIRPLSRRLVAEQPVWAAPAPVPDSEGVAPAEIWRIATSGRRSTHPIAVTVVLVILGLPPTLAFATPGHLGIAVLIAILVLLPCLVAADRLLRRWRSMPTGIAGAVLYSAVLLAATVPAEAAAIGVAAASGFLARLLAWNVLIVLVTGWVLTVAAAGLRETELVRRRLGEVTTELGRLVARTNATLWQRRRELAAALHGPVQSAVIATAIRIEPATPTGGLTADELAALGREMVATLDRLTEEGGTEAPDLPAELAQLSRDWDGVCGIAVEIAPDLPAALAADPACAMLAIDVIAEAISNAVRHGGASSAWVRLRPEAPGRVLVHVRDNGSGIAPAAGRGLGTALLDACAISWQRADEGDGVSLRCVLAPASGAPPVLGRPGLGGAPGPMVRSVRGPTPEAAAADLR